MKQFECTNTFTSTKGEYYAKGARIYENEYYNLTSPDKSNFKEVTSDIEEFQAPPSKDPRFEGLQENGQYDFNDFHEPEDILDDIETGYDDGDFDFGGGSTGGAGASEDFD